MNIDFFVTFLSVIQTKSFTKAAHLTNLSQSTVSNRIGELEKHFDCQLFIRNSGQVEATPSAIKLIPMAEELVLTYNNAREQLASSHAHSNSIRIGSVHAYYDSFLNTFLENYLFQNESMKINLFLKHSNEIIQGVVAGKYDLGFAHHPSNYSRFISKRVYSDELVFVGSEKLAGFENILPFKELENLRVIHSNLFDNYVDDILFKNNFYDFSLDISSQVVPQLLKYKAFAFLPRKFIAPYLKAGRLFEYSIQDYTLPPLEHYVIYPAEFDNEDHPFYNFIQLLIAYTM